MAIYGGTENVLYIFSGRKNGMYTLRQRVSGVDFCSDFYIKTLAKDADKAEKKAWEYFQAHCPVEQGWIFEGHADFDLSEWSKGKSVWMTQVMTAIENGVWPFGKFAGEEFETTEDGYIKWWAKKEIFEGTKEHEQALIARCRGIADERGIFEAEKLQQKKWAEEKANSEHIGTVGERQKFTAKMLFNKDFETQFGTSWVWNFRDSDGNKVVYFGQSDFDGVARGEEVTFMARVKAHEEYRDEKQTIITRPTKCKRVETDNG
jgi:hypothetical protein